MAKTKRVFYHKFSLREPVAEVKEECLQDSAHCSIPNTRKRVLGLTGAALKDFTVQGRPPKVKECDTVLGTRAGPGLRARKFLIAAVATKVKSLIELMKRST